MLKISLIAMFVMTMATFALAASSLPAAPKVVGQVLAAEAS